MPYPSTPLYERLKAEGRLLYDGRWWLHPDYRFNHAAFRPARHDSRRADRGRLGVPPAMEQRCLDRADGRSIRAPTSPRRCASLSTAPTTRSSAARPSRSRACAWGRDERRESASTSAGRRPTTSPTSAPWSDRWPMPGAVAVRFAREPDYFLGTTIMGDPCDVLARAPAARRPAGRHRLPRRAPGLRERAGDAARLHRPDPRGAGFRGRWLVHRGARLLAEMGPPGLLYFGVIAGENPRARELLVGARPPAGLHAVAAVRADDLRHPAAASSGAAQPRASTCGRRRRRRCRRSWPSCAATGRGGSSSPPTRSRTSRAAPALRGLAPEHVMVARRDGADRRRDGRLGPGGLQAGHRRRVRADAAPSAARLRPRRAGPRRAAADPAGRGDPARLRRLHLRGRRRSGGHERRCSRPAPAARTSAARRT